MFEEVQDAFAWAETTREAKIEGDVATRSWARTEIFVPRITTYLDSLPGFNDKVRCSGLWQLCPRRRALNEMFPQHRHSPIEWQLRMIFDIGTGIHDFMQNDHLAKMGTLIGCWVCPRCENKIGPGAYPQEPCPCWEQFSKSATMQDRNRWLYEELTVRWPEWKLEGHVDGALNLEGKDYLLEMKSISGGGFKGLTVPHDDNLYQFNLYLNLFQPPIDQGILLYINKENGDMKEYTVIRDPSVIRDAERKLRAWYGWGASKDTLPERECESGKDKRATRCPQSAVCFDGYAIKFRWEEFQVELKREGDKWGQESVLCSS